MPYQRKNQGRAAAPKRRRYKLGVNLPRWAGGGGINFETSAKKIVRRVVKQELRKDEETKQLPFAYSSNALGHNTMYSVYPWQALNQGTSGSTRVGDQVFLRHMKMRGYASNTTVLPTIKYRILGVWLDKKYPNATTVATATSAYQTIAPVSTDLFFTTHSILSTALINNKLEHQVVFDRLIEIKTEVGTRETKRFDIDVPIMKKVTLQTDNLLKDSQFYVIIIPDGDIVTAGMPVGFLSLQGVLTYTDA